MYNPDLISSGNSQMKPKIRCMFNDSDDETSDSDKSDTNAAPSTANEQVEFNLFTQKNNTTTFSTKHKSTIKDKVTKDMIFNVIQDKSISHTISTPTMKSGINQKLILRSDREIAVKKLMKKSVLQVGSESEHSIGIQKEGRRAAKRRRKEEREKTKGGGWYDLPATEMNDQRKHDLEIIQMRDALDPKMHYKSNDREVLPKYYQVGTVLEHKADFYHSRVPKKQRKQTIVEELLQDAEFQQYNKKKYDEIEKERIRSRKGAFRKKGYPKKKKLGP